MVKLYRVLVVLSFSVSLSACSSLEVADMILHSPTGQENPPNQATTSESPAASESPTASDSPIISGAAVLTQVQNLTPSAKTYPASAEVSGPQDFSAVQVGDWAVYKVLKDGQISSVIKLAVVGKTDDAWIYEFDSYTQDHSSAMQMAVKNLNQALGSAQGESEKILWMKIKDEHGKITKLEGSMLGMMGNMSKAALTGGSPDVSSVEKGGSITVPAGTFLGTWKVSSHVSNGKTSEAGMAWVSTRVPLWHVVKSVSDKGSTSMELVDFGTTGFVSAF